jgi:ApaG protein
MQTYHEVTANIKVEVIPRLDRQHTNPEQPVYVFIYQVKVSNLGDQEIQLLSRKWIITDGNGHIETVEGAGVIGQQPVIPPGSSFSYESFCPLPTPTGNMRGHYIFTNQKGEKIQAKIPLFFLRDFSELH